MNQYEGSSLSGMLKNIKHEHFAGLVAKGVNATEAAVTAGFAEKRACVTGSELLKRAEVAVRIAELRQIATERFAEKSGIDKAWVMNELVEIVKMGKQAEPVLDKDGEAIGEYKQNLAASNKALELIGKELAMFVDRSEVRTGPLDAMEHDELKALKDALESLKPGAAITNFVAQGVGSTRH
jgi:phage terminase small subunit